MITPEHIEMAYRRGFQHGFSTALDVIRETGLSEYGFVRATGFQNEAIVDFREGKGRWQDATSITDPPNIRDIRPEPLGHVE